MAQNKNEMDARKPAKQSAARPEKSYEFMKSSQRKTSNLQIENSVGSHVVAAINAVIEAGDMVSFTQTTDGGAICVCVLHNREPHKAYAKDMEELTDILEAFTV